MLVPGLQARRARARASMDTNRTRAMVDTNPPVATNPIPAAADGHLDQCTGRAHARARPRDAGSRPPLPSVVAVNTPWSMAIRSTASPRRTASA